MGLCGSVIFLIELFEGKNMGSSALEDLGFWAVQGWFRVGAVGRRTSRVLGRNWPSETPVVECGTPKPFQRASVSTRRCVNI